MLKLDLSRPDLLYALVWLVPVVILEFINLDFFLPITNETYVLVIGSVITFFIIYNLLALTISRKSKGAKGLEISERDLARLKYFVKIVVPFWAIVYLLVIFLSGGTPLIWVLTGDARTYTDFGVPSLSGFLYMFRAFLLIACTVIFSKTRERKYLYLSILFILLAFVNEGARGNGVVLILHPIGFFLLLKPTKFIKIIQYGFFAVLFVVAFGLLEQLRYLNEEEYDFVEKYRSSLNLDDANLLTVYSFPILMYATTPIQNLNFQMKHAEEPSYVPYHSTLGLFPTFIREIIFESRTKDYGLLLSEAYNTTSYFSPFMRDFGFTFTLFIVIGIQIIVSLVHISAKHLNSIFARFWYPVLFMCVVMSPFSLFFTSLVAVMFPMVVLIYNTITKKVIS